MTTPLIRQYEQSTPNPRGRIHVDEMTGLVTCSQTYQVAENPDVAISHIPNALQEFTLVIEHEDVTMRLVDRDADRIAQGRSQVVLNFEGLCMGYRYQNRRSQGETQRLRVSLDTPPQQFEPDGTGGMVNIPLTTWPMRFNVPKDEVEGPSGLMEAAVLLVGCVNPKGWDPELMEEGDYWPEGYWLLASAVFERQRCQDYIMDLNFEHRLNVHRGQAYMMHVAPWSHVRMAPVTVDGKQRTEITAIGDVRTPRRYPTAGVAPFDAFNFDDLVGVIHP